MEHGDMKIANQKSSASSDIRGVRGVSCQDERRLVAFALMLLGGVFLWGAATGLAKDKQPTTRTITGTVFDEAGNTIQGAAIELTDVQTGKVLDIYSQEAGQYRMSDLRFDHDYTVKATYEGSSSEVRRISILETRWTLVLNLTIPKAHK
ncbi:MAG: carboxypeptidase-like regulatory domain-containing protein [Terriglobia bacterium]